MMSGVEPKKRDAKKDRETNWKEADGREYWEAVFDAVGSHTSGEKFLGDVDKLMESGQSPQIIAKHLLGGLVIAGLEAEGKRSGQKGVIAHIMSAGMEAAAEMRGRDASTGFRLPLELLEKIDVLVEAGAVESRSHLVRSALALYFVGMREDMLPVLGATQEFVISLIQNPPRMLVYRAIMALLELPALNELVENLNSIREPLCEIISTLKSQPLERVRAAADKLFAGTPAATSRPEGTEDAVDDVDQRGEVAGRDAQVVGAV